MPSHAQCQARRRQLAKKPHLVTKITAEPISTAKIVLKTLEGRNAREMQVAMMLGAAYRRLQLALARLSGFRCPEEKEIKDLIRLYNARIKVPIYATESGIKANAWGPADEVLDIAHTFLKSLKTLKPTDDLAQGLATLNKLENTLRKVLGHADTDPEIAEIFRNLHMARLFLSPSAGTA